MQEPKTHPDAARGWKARAARVFRRVFAARPHLTISEWADKYRWLDEFTAGGARPWKTADVPYLREILDVMSDPATHLVVVMKSAQVAFTQGVLVNVFGYFAHQKPCPMMLLQPSEGDAKAFSKKKLDPVIRATPALRKIIKDAPRKRGEGDKDTLLGKFFPGGFLQMVGAVSPRGLRRDSVKVVLIDEVDGMDPRGAGDEGDQIELAKRRTETFFDWLVVLGSTPTRAGLSKIAPAFQESDQRYYHVPCPHCGEEQPLEWGGRDEAYGIKFQYEKTGGQRYLKPGSVFYLCRANACVIQEHDKYRMISKGRWIAKNPASRTPGFHLNALISPFPGAAWETLAQKWLDAQGNESKLQVFWNTVLGLPWEGSEGTVDADSLTSRKEKYKAQVPRWVGVLIASADVQGSFIEYKVKGYGAGERSCLIHHEQLLGDPGQAAVWNKLEAERLREWEWEGGARRRISILTIDSGGHHTEEVYRYVAPRQGDGVRAVKGSSKPAQPIVGKQTRPSKRYKVNLVPIGTDTAKDSIYSRLRITDPNADGYMHFPDWIDDEYFRQLTSEKPVTRLVGGRPVRRYLKPPHIRNEALDLEVYNYGGFLLLKDNVRKNLGKIADTIYEEGMRLRAEREARPAPVPSAVSGSVRRKKRRRVLSEGV